jgi:hypothetical protein
MHTVGCDDLPCYIFLKTKIKPLFSWRKSLLIFSGNMSTCCQLITEVTKIMCKNRNPHWILAGDFNIIATLNEKKGVIRRLDRDAEVFSSFIEKIKLVDIRTSNGHFTPNKKITLHHQIASILDSFLISE